MTNWHKPEHLGYSTSCFRKPGLWFFRQDWFKRRTIFLSLVEFSKKYLTSSSSVALSVTGLSISTVSRDDIKEGGSRFRSLLVPSVTRKWWTSSYKGTKQGHRNTKMSGWKVKNLCAKVDRAKIITKVRCLRFGHASRMTGNIAGEEFENIVARRRAKPWNLDRRFISRW